MHRRVPSRIAQLLALSALTAAVAFPVAGQEEVPDLPSGGVVIDVDAPENQRYRIAVPNLIGPEALGNPAAEVIRNDLDLISLFEVLPPRSYPSSDLATLDLAQAAWGGIRAQGVVKGEIRGSGNNLQIEMRFYDVSRPGNAVLTEIYRGGPGDIRGFMHDFANKIVGAVTGEPGRFDTQIAFATRIGPGRKDVHVSDFDGFNNRRVSDGNGIAMLPAFGANDQIWYSRLTQIGMFITRAGENDRRIIDGDGLTMSPSICDNTLFFTSTRDGDSDIYACNMSTRRIVQLTNHPAIDVSPTCGPNGKVAFVSTRHGGPQVFIMNADGSDVTRVTFRGNHNQTPAFCPHPDKPLIAFTGRQDGLDIFMVNYRTQDYMRLTQGQGANKDPAFSPDCRMIGFSSNRRGGGMYIMNPRGFNQTRVISGDVETVRWSR